MPTLSAYKSSYAAIFRFLTLIYNCPYWTNVYRPPCLSCPLPVGTSLSHAAIFRFLTLIYNCPYWTNVYRPPCLSCPLPVGTSLSHAAILRFHDMYVTTPLSLLDKCLQATMPELPAACWHFAVSCSNSPLS